MACLLPGGLVIVDFVQDAAAFRSERTVVHARRTACVGRREALLAPAALRVVAHDQLSMHHVDFFPVVVHERLGGKCARLDLEEPRAAAGLFHFIKIGGQDLLVEARRIVRRRLPARLQIDFDELEMLLGLHQAPSSLASSHGARNASSCAIASWISRPSNGGKRSKSSRASARAGERKAARIDSSDSNSSCARSTELPRLTANGSCHSSGACTITRLIPGQRARIGTWGWRECATNGPPPASPVCERPKRGRRPQ